MTVTVAPSPTRNGPSLAAAFTSNSGRRNSCTSKACACCCPPSAPPLASSRRFALPRFIVFGRSSVRSNPPRPLTRPSPFPTSLPCESTSAHASAFTSAGSASTSPRGPAPMRRSQPLTRTVSPGRYIFRSSKTRKRSASVRAVRLQPAPSAHQPVWDGRIARSFPRRATRSGAGASPRARRARPDASDRAVPLPRRSSTSPRGRPSARSLAQATRVSLSANASRPMRVACTQARITWFRVSFVVETGRTTRTSCPSPPSSAGPRSRSVSVSASGSPATRTCASMTRRPGGLAASLRQPRWRYVCQAGQSSGPTAYASTCSVPWLTERTGTRGPPAGSRTTKSPPGAKSAAGAGPTVNASGEPGSSAWPNASVMRLESVTR